MESKLLSINQQKYSEQKASFDYVRFKFQTSFKKFISN